MGELVQEVLFSSFGNRDIRTIMHNNAAFPVVFVDILQVNKVGFVRRKEAKRLKKFAKLSQVVRADKIGFICGYDPGAFL